MIIINVTRFIVVLIYIAHLLCKNIAFAGTDPRKGFDHVLRNHVIDGYVNYKGIKNDVNFESYLKELEEIKNFRIKMMS